jgi:hypothetical protein
LVYTQEVRGSIPSASTMDTPYDQEELCLLCYGYGSVLTKIVLERPHNGEPMLEYVRDKCPNGCKK